MKNDLTDTMPLFRAFIESVPLISPKQLEIRECKVQYACELNALWHSRFPKIDWSNVVRNQDYICFAAYHQGIAVAAAIWSSPIAANRMSEGKTALELRRMAISESCPKNTASFMLKKMRKAIQVQMPHISLLVSYQDTDVHCGTIYKASGWVAAATAQGQSWTNDSRNRNKEQSLAPKTRWEYRLKPLEK